MRATTALKKLRKAEAKQASAMRAVYRCGGAHDRFSECFAKAPDELRMSFETASIELEAVKCAGIDAGLWWRGAAGCPNLLWWCEKQGRIGTVS